MTILMCSFAIVCSAPFQLRAAPQIDGKELEGFQAALAYEQKYGRTDKPPFKLSNYSVVFEGNLHYHFIPKSAPGEKPHLGWSTSLGIVTRIIVDPKSMKVTSAVVE